jgi:hypothetical protein
LGLRLRTHCVNVRLLCLMRLRRKLHQNLLRRVHTDLPEVLLAKHLVKAYWQSWQQCVTNGNDNSSISSWAEVAF